MPTGRGEGPWSGVDPSLKRPNPEAANPPNLKSRRVHPSAPQPEKRIAPDGAMYTKEEFIDFFGQTEGTLIWNNAQLPQDQPAETCRKGSHATSTQPAAQSSERIAVAREVERILNARSAVEILGGGSKKDQRREFNRIVRLLHPDKGLVDPRDERASRAYNLLIDAWSTCNR